MKAFYQALTQITFDATDETSCVTQATNVCIDQFINEHITYKDQSLAYYIAPTNDAYHHEESTLSLAKHICKRAVGTEVPHNPNYTLDMNLPVVGVVGTMTTKLGHDADPTQEQSASHWLSWVLLPKRYTYLGQEYNYEKHYFILFDFRAEYHIIKFFGVIHFCC